MTQPAPAQQATATRAVLELEVNGTRHGDVIVLLQSSDVLVPERALRDAGVVRLRSRAIHLHGVDYQSRRRSEPRLTFQLNEQDLLLEVTAPPSALATARIDASVPAPRGMWHATEPSAYLTYAPSLSDLSLFRTFADAGFTSGPWRVTSTGNYELGSTPVRLMSQLTYADRQNVRELTLGDNYASTGPLGGSVLLGGLGIFRNFELDPYLVRIPQLGYRGSVMAPSTVDVYVNNVLVRRASVAPGEFDLRGIAPASGAGNVRYVVRDPLSRQSDVVVDYYAASGVLAPGLSEYSYAAGFQRAHYGSSSFEYGKPQLLGRYRVGVTEHLTSGFRAEASTTRLSGGSQLTLGGPAGEVELASAVSIDHRRALFRGSAGLLGYYYQRGAISLRAVLKATSPHYTTLSLEPEADRDLVEQSTSVGWSIGRKTTLSTLLGLAFSRDAGPHARSSLILNRQLTDGLFCQLIASRDDRAGGHSDYEAFATVSLGLPHHHTASVSGTANAARSEATASLTRPIMGRTGVGYQASASLAQEPRVSGNVQFQNRLLRADASYFFDGRAQHTLLDASGSLVWLDRAGWFLTRPVQGSFALVEVPDTPGATVLLNNQVVGQTNAQGLLLVPDLQAYYGNRLRVEASDLPSDVEVDAEEVVVAPAPHTGAHVAFASRRLRAVRGRVAPVGLALSAVRYGQLTLSARGRSYVSPIGHEGEFEFEGVPSGVWSAQAYGDGGACRLEIPIPVDGKPIERLGAVPCYATGAP